MSKRVIALLFLVMGLVQIGIFLWISNLQPDLTAKIIVGALGGTLWGILISVALHYRKRSRQ